MNNLLRIIRENNTTIFDDIRQQFNPYISWYTIYNRERAKRMAHRLAYGYGYKESLVYGLKYGEVTYKNFHDMLFYEGLSNNNIRGVSSYTGKVLSFYNENRRYK